MPDTELIVGVFLLKAILCSVAFLLALSGCAYTWQDDGGGTRVIGLVSMRVEPPAGPIAGETISVTALGLSAFQAQNALGISLGYHRHRLANLADNSLVCGPLLLD